MLIRFYQHFLSIANDIFCRLSFFTQNRKGKLFLTEKTQETQRITNND